jgi:hypothetical protein
MRVLSVYRCVVISYVGRCCVWMEICLLILSSSILYTCEIGLDICLIITCSMSLTGYFSYFITCFVSLDCSNVSGIFLVAKDIIR